MKLAMQMVTGNSFTQQAKFNTKDSYLEIFAMDVVRITVNLGARFILGVTRMD